MTTALCVEFIEGAEAHINLVPPPGYEGPPAAMATCPMPLSWNLGVPPGQWRHPRRCPSFWAPLSSADEAVDLVKSYQSQGRW